MGNTITASTHTDIVSTGIVELGDGLLGFAISGLPAGILDSVARVGMWGAHDQASKEAFAVSKNHYAAIDAKNRMRGAIDVVDGSVVATDFAIQSVIERALDEAIFQARCELTKMADAARRAAAPAPASTDKRPLRQCACGITARGYHCPDCKRDEYY